MNLSEENDLLRLIQNTKSVHINGFLRLLKSSNKKKRALKISLVNKMSTIAFFDKESFLISHKITNKKFIVLKYEVFMGLINYLKSNTVPFTNAYLQSKVTEFDILLRGGLFIKAAKKFKSITIIAEGKCDYNTCYLLQRKAIEHRLYAYKTSKSTLKSEIDKLMFYNSLSDNLMTYVLLSNQILNAHYTFLDRRATNSDTILDYLTSPLLQSTQSAKSDLAIYHFYRSKSLVYAGNNNFVSSREYSLKAYKFLLSNPSKYRDDERRLITCLNNYLDASIHLLDKVAYKDYFPKIRELAIGISKGADIYSNVLIFEILTSLELNYYWLTKGVDLFIINQQKFEEDYLKYESIIRPNFKLEILLGFARMNFLKGDFKRANNFCIRILDEKDNPTKLFISCSNLLRLMINYDSSNFDLIDHLITSSKYSLKKRDRLFEIERAFLNGFTQINNYRSEKERSNIFENLYRSIEVLLQQSDDGVIDRKINILEWISSKI